MRLNPVELPGKVLQTVNGYVFGKKGKKTEVNGTACPAVNGVMKNGVLGSGKVEDGPYEKRLFPVEFEWNGPGENVFITGTFYNWSVKIPLSKKSNKFYARIDLPKGHHEFKFIVNGLWKTSFRYPTTANNYGDVNNYVDN